MTPKELIESGNLEMFVAGTLNEQDSLLVSNAIKEFPEVKNEVARIEQAMIAALENEEKFPSSQVKEKLFNELHLSKNTIKQPKANYFWQYSAAAMLLVLIGAGFLIYNLIHQRNELHAEVFELKNDVEGLENKSKEFENAIAKNFTDLKVYRSHDFKKSMLMSTSADNKMVCVYWNPISKEIFLDNCGLENPGNGKVYQLWAMKDGVPVSLGTFDKASYNNGLQKMNEVAKVDKFAVTIENAGGASIPTLSTMQVIGKI
jgi:anti-sigma-K factor RskA